MKKIFYTGFCLALSLGFGCAITAYDLITDNDQVKNGGAAGSVVNTSGKAHLVEGIQIATLWPDGTDESINFVDQKANGDRTLTMYNNYTSGATGALNDDTFHDDLYCNPDWQGCAVNTSDDPQSEATNPPWLNPNAYDYNANFNCDGARSFSLLLATTRYYGECGRARMGLADRIALMNSASISSEAGMEGLLFNLNHSNFSITLNSGSLTSTVPTNASGSLFVSLQGRKGVLHLENPLFGTMGNRIADFISQAGHGMTATMTYNGISIPFHMAGNYGVSNAARWRSNINKLY